jgi:hypothetical protein
VIDGRTGRLVMPVPNLAVNSPGGVVMFLPEERDDALQIMLQGVGIDPAREAACDRWSAYHGKARERFWGSFGVEGARMGREVADIDELDPRNALDACEGRLCRAVNADRGLLARACRDANAVDAPDPLCVGVDDRGVDVKARFGILRLEFGQRAGTEEAAAREIEKLLRGAS